MHKTPQVSSSPAIAAMDRNMKSPDLSQSDSLKSFQLSLLRPRSIDSDTAASPDPDVGLGEFEPTETEELSETEYDDSQYAIVATQVEEEHSIKGQQHQQQQQRAKHKVPIIPPFRGSHRKKEEKTTTITAANANTDASPEVAGIIHSSKNTSPALLLSVQELTDLLHEANQDATVYRNKRRHRRVPTLVDVNVNDDNVEVEDGNQTTSNSPPGLHLLKLDDMTSVLKHINMAEEAKRPIRWDLIGEMTAVVYGAARNQPNYAANDTESADDDFTASVECTSREILTMMLEHDESVCNSDCGTADVDGYPLNPSAYTCASSVTWFDSSLYEEIEVSDDECDFYEEIVVDEDDENENSCVSLVFEGECASFISGS
jgi:hypothetical protein